LSSTFLPACASNVPDAPKVSGTSDKMTTKLNSNRSQFSGQNFLMDFDDISAAPFHQFKECAFSMNEKEKR
jgi:hypothetical protein